MVLVDAGGVGTLAYEEAYTRCMRDMSLISLVHGHFRENSQNRNGICTRFTYFILEINVQAVLNVQKECVKMCVEEGHRTLDHIHQESVDHLSRELRNLGFDLGYRVPTIPSAYG